MIASLVILVMFSTSLPALAHIEKGNMPDSVAETEYRILLEFKPEDHKTRLLLGMTLFRQNKLHDAEKEFRHILKSEPKNFDALDSLGLLLLKEKRFPEALQLLQSAIAIRPTDVLIHLHLGLTLTSVNQTELARSTLTKGLTLLNTQGSSLAKEQQTAEFKTALANLQKHAVTKTRE